jgi:hypothetical protein
MPSQFRSDEAAAWLQFAADDLDTARVLLGAMPPRVRQSLFHAQQAAEKSLKAFLIWHEQPFPLTHDLARLLNTPVNTAACRSLRLTHRSLTVAARNEATFGAATVRERWA